MRISFINMRKYKISRMPWYMYLPKIERYWSGKIWQFTIFRDYGITFDFRGDILNEMVPEKERESFWRRVALRLNLLNRQN
jgi:hypothetical protein